MSYKVIIQTLAGDFVTTAPENTDDALKWAENILEKKTTFILGDGTLWKPWNRQHIVGLAVSYTADDGDDGIHKKATTVTEPNPTTQLTPLNGDAGNFYLWNKPVTYFNQTYTATILSTWDSEQRSYLLLFTIDGKAAKDMLHDRSHKQFIDTWLEQNYTGHNDATYTVVIPHGAIYDLEEAKSYLQDYVRESAPAHKAKRKTGKVYTGWNEDRGRK